MLRKALVLGCLLLGFAAPAALGASTTQILRDCADDGVLQGDYTPSELRKARQNIPADTDEYTDCRDVLARAAAAGVAASSSPSSPNGGSGSSGAASKRRRERANEPPADPDTPEGRAIVGGAGAQPPPEPVVIRGRPVIPGTAGLAGDGARNDLPTSLLVVLILLGAGALAAFLPFARRHVLARLRR